MARRVLSPAVRGTARLLARLPRGSVTADLDIALYDPSVDLLRFPQSYAELASCLGGQEISDAKEWLVKAEVFVPRDGVILDVGAYRGMTVQWFARQAQQVYAFEPLPQNLASLRRVLDVRGIGNVEVIETAVSDRVGTATLYVCQMQGHNSLGPVGTSPIVGEREVPTTTLDAFTAERDIATIDFLKVDVEGFEFEVLSGASGLLGRQAIGRVFFEVSQAPLESLGRDIGPVVDLLTGFGYRLWDIDGNPVSRDEVLRTRRGDFLATASSTFAVGTATAPA